MPRQYHHGQIDCSVWLHPEQKFLRSFAPPPRNCQRSGLRGFYVFPEQQHQSNQRLPKNPDLRIIYPPPPRCLRPAFAKGEAEKSHRETAHPNPFNKSLFIGPFNYSISHKASFQKNKGSKSHYSPCKFFEYLPVYTALLYPATAAAATSLFHTISGDGLFRYVLPASARWILSMRQIHTTLAAILSDNSSLRSQKLLRYRGMALITGSS